MYRVLNNEAPEYISNLYTHTPSRYSNSRNYQLSLPRPRIDIFKTSISFSGAYLWNNLPPTVRSCQSLSSFKRKLRAHLEVATSDGLWHNTARERDRLRFSSDCHCNDWSFEIYFMHPYNSAQSFRLLVRVTFLFFSLSLTVLYKISIGCFRFLFQYWSYELIKCSTALFAGCILIMSIWVIYACVHLALWTRYDVCENSHSLVHAYMYINYACNFI